MTGEPARDPASAVAQPQGTIHIRWRESIVPAVQRCTHTGTPPIGEAVDLAHVRLTEPCP